MTKMSSQKRKYLSTNINEVIRAVLNFLFFYVRFCTHRKAQKGTKSTKRQKRYKKYKKHQKHKKHKNATNQQYKTQISEQKFKMRLKNI